MPIPRLYHDGKLVVGESVSLSPTAARHAIQVLRLRAGASVILFNGQGGEYECLIESASKAARVNVLRFSEVDRESPVNFQLIQGISRSERMDFVIQKSTELGVSRILPVFTERSVVKLTEERAQKKLRHWEGVALHACEQSGRTACLNLDMPTALSTVIAKPFEGTRIILDPRVGTRLQSLPLEKSIQVLIGPEGGLSEKECTLAEENGFTRVNLGPRILRTETAPLVVFSILGSLLGDL